MNNPFDYTPDKACEEAFKSLTERIECLKASDKPDDINFVRELKEGKMLGVLIATDDNGHRHTLYAFSGQLGCGGFHHEGFVGPVFDYLNPDEYFKTKEAEISRLNADISIFEKDTLARAKKEYEEARKKTDEEISEYKEKYRVSKMERASRRESGLADENELADMIRRSQFEKAELHRLKKRLADALMPLADNLKDVENRLDIMKRKRRSDSESLQKWLFTNFRVLNALGESRSLSEIFAETAIGIPPSGAGECCAPKLLQAAYLKGWHPEAIAEYWYGKSKDGEVRIHGRHYPACRGKCLPVLGWMLRGLDVEPPIANEPVSTTVDEPELLYENSWFCIVNKPAGMLSVPGKGNALSVQRWLEKRYGPDRQIMMAHRIDQDTSGLLIATFGELAYKVTQRMFAMRHVKKTYVAVLEGDYESLGKAPQGRIELRIAPDHLDRPRQRVDAAEGKESLTEYEFIGVTDGHSRIIFHPATGRTHQLRVHAASEEGLGMPIVGDRLYGIRDDNNAERMLLHAQRLEFTFPIDKKQYLFESPVPF